MSKLVGTVYAVQAIPRSLIDDRSINPHVYASSAGVELVAEPVALKPAAARELAKLLNDAADECDRAPANWCLVAPAMPPRCPFCLQPAPKAADPACCAGWADIREPGK